MVPLTSSDNTCQMELKKFTPELAGEWSGDTFDEVGRTDLVMQQDVSRVEVSLSGADQVEGEEIIVTCTVEGGTPTPSVEFMLMKADQSMVENSTERFTNMTELSDEGKVVGSLRLSKEDQGLVVCCHAVQWDKAEPRVTLATKDNVR